MHAQGRAGRRVRAKAVIERILKSWMLTWYLWCVLKFIHSERKNNSIWFSILSYPSSPLIFALIFILSLYIILKRIKTLLNILPWSFILTYNLDSLISFNFSNNYLFWNVICSTFINHIKKLVCCIQQRMINP